MRPLLLTLLVLVTVSVGVTVVWAVCWTARPQVAMFTTVPTPTGVALKPTAPPPTQAEEWTGTGAGLSWLITFGAAVGLGVRWLVNRKRTRMAVERTHPGADAAPPAR